MAHRLLQCLVVAVRPLRVVELAELLAVDFDDGQGTPNLKLNSSWQWKDHGQALLLSCSSLISIVKNDDHIDIDRDDGDSRVVQLSHLSVKEFLTSPRLATPRRDVYIDLEPSHMVMAQACLGILLRLDDSPEENGAGNSSSLARYAAEHWVTHAQFQNVSSHVQNAMESLFDPDKPYFKAWLQLYDLDMDLPTSPLFQFTCHREHEAGPLYYAALCGFKGLVETLIVKYPHLVNATGGYYKSPAMAALGRRHFELSRMLHRNGSSLDLPGFNEWSPLHSAVCQGASEIIPVLLDCKLDINARCRHGQTPLHLALTYSTNSSGTIRLLLTYGADPNTRMSDGSTPLHLASSMGMVEDSLLLLEYGADVEAVDGDGRTALQVASENGRYEIMNCLFAYGAKDMS